MKMCAAHVCALCLVVILPACTSTITRPISVDENSFSLSAEQRVFLSRDRSSPFTTTHRVTCAEPSPDALKAVAASLSAQAEAAGQGGGGFSSSSAESAASIGLRTATIQLLRDGLYRICEAYANGALSEFGYALALSNFDEIMIRLISVEGLTGTRQATQVVIGTSTQTKGTGQSTAPDAASNEEQVGGEVQVTTETSAQAGSTEPQLHDPKIEVHQAESREIAEAVRQIALNSRPEYHSTASACMMWLSFIPSRPDPNHQALATFCANFLAKLPEMVMANQQRLAENPPIPVTQD